MLLLVPAGLKIASTTETSWTPPKYRAALFQRECRGAVS